MGYHCKNHSFYSLALKSIFQLFKTDIISFRLIKRPPFSSYGLHHDRDRGQNVERFQIPIHSTSTSLLCLSKATDIPEERTDSDLYTDSLFQSRFPENRIEPLYEGFLYTFNTDYIHTLYHNHDSYRITLLIDVIMNEYMETMVKKMIPI